MSSRGSAIGALDDTMMREALRLARRGDGRTFPNPSVGAVVYRGDRILGRGTTRPPGGDHAEIVAMKRALSRHGPRALRGASLAVTLEPCNFTGRTGPCTEAILEAGIRRVVTGVGDPHPKVSGKGIRRLRRQGVEVKTRVLESECRQQHRGFLSVCEQGRPFVTLKLATTLDGRIALSNGESRWITSPPARAFVHRLRDAHDAVLVGSETAIADDPELTVRRDGKIMHRPVRLVVDGRLRVPADSKLFDPAGDSRTWILCRQRARGLARMRSLADRVLEVPVGDRGHLDLRAGFRRLAHEGLTTVLVEGGGGLAAALLRARLVDEVHWLLAPRLIGSDGRPGLGPLELTRLADSVDLEVLRTRRIGPDLHIHGRVRTRRVRKLGAGRSSKSTR
jgi:diaminohydroxyphosphoribosylaminopyrimidine deaminase/5-amino-6-(5-phosphoribosylamino)uracil reductase